MACFGRNLVPVRGTVLLLNIFGNINHHRTGSAGTGQFKSLIYDFRNIRRIQHQKTVFDNGPGDADDIRFLKRISADGTGRDLPGNKHRRDRVHIGICDPADQIGGTGAAGGHTDADFARGPGVTACSKSTALFVAGKDHADLGFGQCLMQFNRLTAGIREDSIYAMTLQTADDDLTSLQRCSLCMRHFFTPDFRFPVPVLSLINIAQNRRNAIIRLYRKRHPHPRINGNCRCRDFLLMATAIYAAVSTCIQDQPRASWTASSASFSIRSQAPSLMSEALPSQVPPTAAICGMARYSRALAVVTPPVGMNLMPRCL